MILVNLTLTDFSIFRGTQSVSLVPRSDRPVVLFGGKNGAGKSTLLEAIRLCLYGPLAIGPRVSREAYLHYLEGRIHSNPNCLIQPSFSSIAVDFQYADVEAVHTYKVTRSWERRSARSLFEHLEVERDGKPLGEIESEHWQDFVRDLIPPGVAQLFFFDGEKIQQLAEDSSDQQTLADSIKSLLGLDVVERLQTDLGLYLSRMAKTAKNGQPSGELEELEREIESVRQDLEALRGARDQFESELAELRSAIAKVEAKLASEGGSFARNRERLLQERAAIKAQIAQHENSLRQLCAGLLPFALIPKLCLQLKNHLLLEERAGQVRAGQALLQSAKGEIVERIEAPDFWRDFSRLSRKLRTEIKAHVKKAINAPVGVERAERVELVHQLSPSVQRQIISWIDQATNESPSTLRSLAEQFEQLNRELYKIEGTLRKIPPDEVLKPILEELGQLHRELAETSKRALLKDEEVRAAELKLAEMERRYNQAAERLSELAAQGTRIHLVQRTQRVLDEYKQEILERRVRQLEQAVSDCFNRLCRKKDSLRRIAIDPRDFSVKLYDRKNKPIPKSQLSAGEKQVYAVSMLWALAKTSGRPLPIIIDTPLARLDSDHRRLLVQQYFPAASHQVVILSTDTEVDQSYFSELRGELARAYRLDFDPEEVCTKITPGYFWKDGDETH